ncbi:MAG: hypothetical protein A2086_03350 [Spirochaetes bacterium GWD1_27_9]|nr:MAG: hypothetical protein A2Z98_12580 [Spirochaetes bacterium GWB1_27_13]OHD45285.1 MAG: hypothetical protein A2086_03350 [Spirochaetes bacterium GWD1_27_9]
MTIDVQEIIIDGVSGQVPTKAEKYIFVGTCSKGIENKIYTFGKNSDYKKELGEGRLTDKIKDFFSVLQEEAIVIAIPSEKDIAGEIREIIFEGTGKATYTVTGNSLCDTDIVIQILSGGALNEATAKISIDGGDNWMSPFTMPVDGKVNVEIAGIVVTFANFTTPSQSFVTGDRYFLKTISPKSGITALIEAIEVGLELYTPRYVYVCQDTDSLHWVTFGMKADELFSLHKPTYFITDTREKIEAIKRNGTITISTKIITGLSKTDDFVEGCSVTGDGIPTNTIITKILSPTSVEINNNATKTQTISLLIKEDISNYVNSLVKERQSFSHRFVAVCAGYGEVIEKTGISQVRNYSGVMAGTIASARVNESIGKVKKFPISNVKLPQGWTNTHSTILNDAGFVVLRRLEGLNSLYFARGNTLAEDTSDYKYIEIVDTVFKAIRLGRVGALKDLQSEGDSAGITNAHAEIITAISTMTSASPKELDSFEVIIPPNQDIVNNGLVFNLVLYGIPIIKNMKLNFMFKYANPFEE